MTNPLEQYLLALEHDATCATVLSKRTGGCINQVALQSLLQLIEKSTHSELYACLLLLVLADIDSGNIKGATKKYGTTQKHIKLICRDNVDRKRLITELQNKIDMTFLAQHSQFLKLCSNYYLLIRSQKKAITPTLRKATLCLNLVATLVLTTEIVTLIKPKWAFFSRRASRLLCITLLITSLLMKPSIIFQTHLLLSSLATNQCVRKIPQSLLSYFLNTGYNEPLQLAHDQVYADDNALALHVTQKFLVIQKIQKTIKYKNQL